MIIWHGPITTDSRLRLRTLPAAGEYMHHVICSGDSDGPLGATEDAVRATHDEREII